MWHEESVCSALHNLPGQCQGERLGWVTTPIQPGGFLFLALHSATSRVPRPVSSQQPQRKDRCIKLGATQLPGPNMAVCKEPLTGPGPSLS